MSENLSWTAPRWCAALLERLERDGWQREEEHGEPLAGSARADLYALAGEPLELEDDGETFPVTLTRDALLALVGVGALDWRDEPTYGAVSDVLPELLGAREERAVPELVRAGLVKLYQRDGGGYGVTLSGWGSALVELLDCDVLPGELAGGPQS